MAFAVAAAAYGASIPPVYEASASFAIGKFEGALFDDPRELAARIKAQYGRGPDTSVSVESDLQAFTILGRGNNPQSLVDLLNKALNDTVERHSAYLEGQRAWYMAASTAVSKRADRIREYLDGQSVGGDMSMERAMLIFLVRQGLSESLANAEREARILHISLSSPKTMPTEVLRRAEISRRNLNLSWRAYGSAGLLMGIFVAILLVAGLALAERHAAARASLSEISAT